MLYDLIYGLLVLPLYSVANSLHGHWSSLHAFKNFFWLLPVIFTPGLILAAPVAFGVMGSVTGRLTVTFQRLYIILIAGVLYIPLAGVMEYVAEIGLSAKNELIDVVRAFTTILLPTTAFGIFCFWLPMVVCGTYTTMAKHPKWWISSFLGTVVLILGIWIWVIIGTLIGAATD